MPVIGYYQNRVEDEGRQGEREKAIGLDAAFKRD